MMMLAVMVMKGRGRGTSPLARRVDHPSRADERRIDASEHSEQTCGWRTGKTMTRHAHARQAWREAGDVADGGDRPSTLAKGAAATLSHCSGVCIGAILGGRRALCRLAVLRLLGTSLGWLAAAGLKLTDGHLRGPGASHEARECRRRAREAHLVTANKARGVAIDCDTKGVEGNEKC